MTSRPSEPLRERLADEAGIGGSLPDTIHRAGAKAVITARGDVLLVRERHSDGSAFWTLPGGGVETDETVQEALRREIREELQSDCTVGSRLGACVYDHHTLPIRTVYTLLRAELGAAPEPDPDEGIVEHAWRHPGNLPPATLDPIQDALETLFTTR